MTLLNAELHKAGDLDDFDRVSVLESSLYMRNQLLRDTDWASMAAAGVIGALPIVLFALLVQRHLVRGLTLGAVK